jgi:major type 1 subunit fimbrin (pilin)
MKNNILATLIAVAVSSPLMANASDGTITFAGTVSANTCVIKINDGASTNTVTLAPVNAALLNASGKTAMRTDVRIGLSACTGVTSARAFFETGPNVTTDTKNLKNNGTATNVEVQLLTPADTAIAIGDTAQRSAAVTTLTDGATVLTYKAQYYSTAAAGAGTVDTSVTYSIDYL